MAKSEGDKFFKRRAHKSVRWERKTEFPLRTTEDILVGSASVLGMVGVGVGYFKGYLPFDRIFFVGTEAFLAGIGTMNFFAKARNADDVKDRIDNIHNSRIASRTLKLFGLGLITVHAYQLVSPADQQGEASANGSQVAVTSTTDASGELHGHCRITAPLPPGELTDEQVGEAKQLQRYFSGLQLPNNGGQLAFIAEDDNNFGTGSQLSENINVFQQYYGIPTKRLWDQETCSHTPYWQAED